MSTYRDAGVDLEAGNEAVRRIVAHARSTYRPGVLGDLGGFGGFFALDTDAYRQPVLVAGTDGVGTKLKVAFMMDRHDTVGIDLVAMCVNDIAVQGAEPLFFLDYLATGKLDPARVEEIVRGIAEGCRQAGCALIGGETAEMPGFYDPGEYDLAGFAVGVVEREALIDGSKVRAGDALIGLASSGLHSNGYSLARKILFEQKGYRVTTRLESLGRPLGEELLEPTRIYAKLLREVLSRFPVSGMAHITGGGLPDNLARILPEGCRALVRKGSWEVPPVFRLLQAEGRVEEGEMFRTFNMGIGLVLAVPPGSVEGVTALLRERGEKGFLIGQVAAGDRGVELV